MKKAMLGIFIAFLVVLSAIVVLGVYKINKDNKGVACTLEARICPDGSAVGRTAPDCEFAPCPEINSGLSESEARVIAEKACIKGGESLAVGSYNKNTKTWWFDANLNSAKEGCSPACVVSEETKLAEINWRCTGLIVPDGEPVDIIKKLFAEKYPKYAETVSVRIDQQTEKHARGMVDFVTGESGGIFLATKIDGQWQIVHDGNGAIPCSLSEYGFPGEMLSDCAK